LLSKYRRIRIFIDDANDAKAANNATQE